MSFFVIMSAHQDDCNSPIYKIGVTGGEVKTRIANAKLDSDPSLWLTPKSSPPISFPILIGQSLKT
jgi:hypothetical protein